MASRKSRKTKIFWGLFAVILVIAIVLGVCWYFLIYSKGITLDEFLHNIGMTSPEHSDDEKDNPSQGGPVVSGNAEEIASADLSIHFIAPAVKASGDCTLIKVGNTEVLIDAGPTQGNVDEIKDYLEDAAKAKLSAEEARREVERLRREIGYLKENH